MFSSILSVISFIRELIALIRSIQDFLEKERSAKAEKNRQELEKALEDLKNAKTEKEFDDAQARVVAHKP